MPQVARRSLAAPGRCLVLAVGLALSGLVGIPGASAQPAAPGGTWTDPPARRPDAEKRETGKRETGKPLGDRSAGDRPVVEAPVAGAPVAETPRAAAPRPAPAPTLAAAPKAEIHKAGTPEADAPRPRDRPAVAARRSVPAPRRVATAPRTRDARPPRVAAAPRARPPRDRRIVAAAPVPRAVRDEAFTGYRPYAPIPYGYGPLQADDRLERLRAAEAAGFLVVRRRSVEFPDGRSLRTYRPVDGDDGY